jgi:hypothetical protein
MEARMRSIVIALAVAASPSLALAQTATTTTTQSRTTAPVSNTTKIEEPKSKIPPAANTTTRGLHVGKDALDAGSIEIKRNK